MAQHTTPDAWLLPLLLPSPQSDLLRFPLSVGAPERIRTPNLQIRSLMLYPVELRARVSRATLVTDRAADDKGASACCERRPDRRRDLLGVALCAKWRTYLPSGSSGK